MDDKKLYEQILDIRAPWYVKAIDFNKAEKTITIKLDLKGKVVCQCPECCTGCPGYDRQTRKWRQLDTVQFATFLEADVPRCDCPDHGVKLTKVPWAEQRSRFTLLFETIVLQWLLHCSIKETAQNLNLSWDEVSGIQKRAIKRGQSLRQRYVPTKIGIDEKSHKRGHKYITNVIDLDTGKVIFTGLDRKQETLETFFAQFTSEELKGIEAIAVDMWDPFLAAIKKYIPNWEQKVVFDRFHVMKMANVAVDQVRRQENRSLIKEKNDLLKGSKWIWLTNQANHNEYQRKLFKELRKYDLKTLRAWAMKKMLQRLWDYKYLGSAKQMFQRWYIWATHSQMKPFVKLAKSLKGRLTNILTYLQHGITNAASESVNSKIQWLKYRSRGFRSTSSFIDAITFHCGGLKIFPL